MAKAIQDAPGAPMRSRVARRSARRTEPPRCSHGSCEAEVRFSENAAKVLERRYLRKDEAGKLIETPEEMLRRVAKNIASSDARYENQEEVARIEKDFFEIMASLEFLPNSPTLMNAGADLQQLSACFVLPVEDSMESIFEAVKNTALIHKSGGGTGFSFSKLRPRNDVVLSTRGISSGPVSFMTVFDSATDAIKQGGTRRGANMGLLRVDHPDVLDFITAKNKENCLNNFNLSVGVTERFMEAVEKDEEYDLINPRTNDAIGKLKARKVFRLIVLMAWKNGEPGVVFLDRLNRDNPTPHLGRIESTNPCGEQPLLPYESCNLGSINLSKMVRTVNGRTEVDFERLQEVIPIAVRFLDNVIDVNKYPIPDIEKMSRGTRKIGLGVMGFADMLLKLGIPYDSQDAIELAEKVMSLIQAESKKASVELARKKGVFPVFKGSASDSPGAPRVRNATTTTIAPTGTLSILADCSSGIEPLFAISYIKNVMDNTELPEVNKAFRKTAEDRGFYTEELARAVAAKGSLKDIEGIPEDVKRVFVTAHDITPEWHVRMQAAFQKHTDNAVSKTINFGRNATVADVENAYMLAYRLQCKGVTIYRDGSRERQVLTIGREDKKLGGRLRGRLTPRSRPLVTRGSTEKIGTGCGSLYVTVNEDEQGPFEVFARLGKTGGCAASQTEAISRLVSLALRSGIDIRSTLTQLKGIRCPQPLWDNGSQVLSCPDAIGKAIERFLERSSASGSGFGPSSGEPGSGGAVGSTGATVASSGVSEGARDTQIQQLTCPDCGGKVEPEGGCLVCHFCGFSRCG
ncbi:MAG: vitamin B12-dependent ribonucleotide reductase [Candidatus Eisenbacteria bacterium]|nr:vitamin B12-dependent ribonucleotide reductase [Candidatus Eisenbacteria bacterium]